MFNDPQYRSLPHYAKLAVERLYFDESLRTPTALDELLRQYGEYYRVPCDDAVRARAHDVCGRRLIGFDAEAA